MGNKLLMAVVVLTGAMVAGAETNVMTGLMNNNIITCPISDAWEKKGPLDMELFNMIEKLSK